MKIVELKLSEGEYYKEEIKKTTIYLHQTAGGNRPDFTIQGWNADRNATGGRLAVATSYVIGGLSTTVGKDGKYDSSYDGVIYCAFEDKYWAHHLGTKLPNNSQLNKQSIGIEICNYGPLTKTADGKFINYVNKEVPADMVVELPIAFKGFKYYHKYTDKQIQAVKELLIDISLRHKIDLKKGMQEILLKYPSTPQMSWDISSAATSGKPGLFTHVNVRKDKFDCFPQESLISMIISL